MSTQKTSVMANGWLWMGAAISISEILTGSLIAPLGWRNGLLSIMIGHIIGGIIMYYAGFIGAKTGLNAMGTLKISFGEKGGNLFSVLNVMQLVGWTAVMVFNGAHALNLIVHQEGLVAKLLGSLIIAGLIFVWVYLDTHALTRLNSATVVALVALCLLLSFKIGGGSGGIIFSDGMSFGAAVELSVALPISWVPVIADYTSKAERPVFANTVSSLSYFIGSIWMFVIGMGAAIMTGFHDVSELFVAMGLGIIGLLIVIGSTVTTTYLDARSAAISFRTMFPQFGERPVALWVVVIGFFIAIAVPPQYFEQFLYLIGSCFTPMISILMTDYLLLKKTSIDRRFDAVNLGLWCIGFVFYRFMMHFDFALGYTLPTVLIMMAATFAVNHKRFKA